MNWYTFAARVGLFSEPRKSSQEWAAWCEKYQSPVSFPTGRKWRNSIRATGQLDTALRVVKELIGSVWVPPSAVHGFVRRRSTFTGALPHAGASMVLAVDLKDFFDQVTFGRVQLELAAHFDHDVLEWIAGACFVNDKLPFGYRTSPVLSNIAFEATDLLLQELAVKFDVRYTRWVDDLSFSGPRVDDFFLTEVLRILAGEAWEVNTKKVRFMRRSPYVLGLYVGRDVKEPRLPRWLKSRLLVETHYFSRYGSDHFSRDGVYPPERLFGLVAHAHSIEPEFGAKLDARLRRGKQIN